MIHSIACKGGYKYQLKQDHAVRIVVISLATVGNNWMATAIRDWLSFPPLRVYLCG